MSRSSIPFDRSATRATPQCAKALALMGLFFLSGRAMSVQCPGTLKLNSTARSVSNACPHPYRTVTHYYRCADVCGTQPQASVSGTATGDCGIWMDYRGCAPVEGAIFQYSNPPRLFQTLYNKYLSASLVCLNNGTTTIEAECGCGPVTPDTCGTSPVLISLGDQRLELTDALQGVEFDIDDDGSLDRVSWTEASSDDAFLVLERDGNGTIDSGRELFGDSTPQDPGEDQNGFNALALFDDQLNGGDEDGSIGVQDSVFLELQLWLDSNHDGISQSSELRSLAEAHVVSIDLAYHQAAGVDEHGNHLRYFSLVEFEGGRRGLARDVYFVEEE